MSCEAFYVYMMTNKGQTTLYIGVTNSLVRRVHQHRPGDVSGFAERYNPDRLVYHGQYNDPRDVVAELAQREEGREGPGPFVPYRGISKGCRAGTVDSSRPSRRRR